MPLRNSQDSGARPGLRVRESAFTGSELGMPMLGAVTATRGFCATPVSWHRHDRHELLLLLSGGATYEFKTGGEREVAGGRMLVVPPRLLHRPQLDIRMPAVICAVSFQANPGTGRTQPFTPQEAQWIGAQFQSRAPGLYTMSPLLRRMAHALHQAVLQQRPAAATPDATASLRLLIASVLVEAARHTRGVPPPGAVRTVGLAREYMEENFGKPIQMNSLAEHSGCSRAHLFLVFKRETGMSPNDWLQRRRIRAACELLRTTDRKLEDIASAAGFSSAQYFCQVFRKYTGGTPGGYRKK